MNEEQLYERIDSYLSGRMPPEEAAAFRREMAADPALAAEVALHRGIADAVEGEKEELALRDKIGAILEKGRAEAARPPARRRFLFHFPLRIAAAVTLITLAVVAAYFYLNPSGGDNPEALFAQYIDYPSSIYEEESVRSGERQGTEEEEQAARLDSLWVAAGRLYRQEQYTEALALLDQLERLETLLFDQPSSHYHFSKGILQAQAGQYRAAIFSFEQVRASYTEEAAWKRAVTMLRLEGRRAGAIRALREISRAETPRREDARALLEQLGAGD